ncbi:MAG TPA: DUF6084 family protein [Verrucomicrobiae bacterium]|jgi:uncharacterized protein (DUF697 family)|nr:DUF6084 family protein [Verrucomicrobiae bacterium]
MPDLEFQVTGVEAATRGLTPLLHFKLEISNKPEKETIQAVMLHAQVQIQTPQRAYNADEKEKLVELFGAPERWGQTLRNRLWGFCNTTVGAFAGKVETVLAMPCTFDLNVAATKYFQGLEEGDAPVLFLFSGSVFYESKGGQLQVEQISWNKECAYRMPLQAWRDLMEHHFPNSAWFYVNRDVFERLCAYKRSQGFTNWDETISCLLGDEEKARAAV